MWSTAVDVIHVWWAGRERLGFIPISHVASNCGFLFDRVGRNIRLTATAAAFRDHTGELLDHACRLEARAAAARPVYPTATLVRSAFVAHKRK